MGKNNRGGQAAILSDSDYARIRKQIQNERLRLIWDIARYTGERWGAVLRLQTSDVFDESSGKPLEEITFQAKTRKASPDGKRKTRQVPIHSTLYEILERYKPPAGKYLFPGRVEGSISFQAVDQGLRRAIARAGLDTKGISTHSTRRTFITRLHRAGIDVYTIKKITGHQDLKALGHYIDIDANRVKEAIAII